VQQELRRAPTSERRFELLESNPMDLQGCSIEEQCLFEVLQEQCEKAEAAGGELDGVVMELTQEMIDAKMREKAANKTPQK
jgi:hypothetical protein